MLDNELKVIVTLGPAEKFAGTYELDVKSCTGRDDLDCRRETGLSLLGLFAEVEKDPGLTLTVACVVVWLVRRRQFADMVFASVLDSVGWGADVKVDTSTGAEPEGKAVSVTDTPES